jgi:hypothetical protein
MLMLHRRGLIELPPVRQLSRSPLAERSAPVVVISDEAHPICFLQTFVDPQRFRGTCYRAANWTLLGITAGRGKNAPTRSANRSIKQVLGYPLDKDFRQRLSQVAEAAGEVAA